MRSAGATQVFSPSFRKFSELEIPEQNELQELALKLNAFNGLHLHVLQIAVQCNKEVCYGCRAF
jgi:hypothetical protein